MLSLIPRPVARVYFSSNNTSSNRTEKQNRGGEDESEAELEQEEMIAQLEEMLDVFGNAYMNKHLVYNMLELVLVRLVPEMAERGTGELLRERGVERF